MTLLIFLLVLAGALAATYALARGLSRPVRRLADGVARIRQLDIASVPPLPPGPFRELNQASRAFNAMVASL